MLANQRNLCRLFTSLLLSFSTPVSVLAATLTWQGPYMGAYMGGGYGKNQVYTNAGRVTDTSYFPTSVDINSVNHSGIWAKDPNKIIAGIQAGHDWTCRQIVFGIVLDYNTLPLHSSKNSNLAYPDNTDEYSLYTSMRTNWLFTLRGRLGYQPPVCLPTLFYLTGGMAITQLKVRNHFADNSAFAGIGGSRIFKNQIGWVGGAGVEIVAYDRVSIELEYLHVKIPTIKTSSYIVNTEGGFGISAPSMISPLATTAKFRANIFRIGLNYRF